MIDQTKVYLKRFDKSLPLPQYKTGGAVGFDLYAREDVEIEPHKVKLIPLNNAIKIPENTFLLLANRGSTHKLGITCVNGIGVGDPDYSGDNDEYSFPAYNFTDKTVKIEKGMRIAQAVIIPFVKVNIEEVESLDKKDRGAYGTTGVF